MFEAFHYVDPPDLRGSTAGEVCTGGLRYGVKLAKFTALPIKTDLVRDALTKELERKLKR